MQENNIYKTLNSYKDIQFIRKYDIILTLFKCLVYYLDKFVLFFFIYTELVFNLIFLVCSTFKNVIYLIVEETKMPISSILPTQRILEKPLALKIYVN